MNRTGGRIPTLADEWERFVLMSRLKDDGPDVVARLRRIFMAGAWSAMIIQRAILDSTLTDEGGAFAMNMLDQECQEFAEGVISGKY
jgi:hypothetical protein